MLKGLEPEVWPLLAEVEEPPEALSSSALRSFDGDRLTLLWPSRLFSGGTGCGAAVGPAGAEAGELERRNKFGAWLEELVSGTSG